MRSLPLETRTLRIVPSRCDDHAVVLGAARLVIHDALQRRVDRTIAEHAELRHAPTASLPVIWTVGPRPGRPARQAFLDA